MVEVIFGLVILELGILAAFGMVLISQRSLHRAEVTLRGVLEAGWIADSLFQSGAHGSGSVRHPWGEVSWSQASTPIPALRFTVWSPAQADTVFRFIAVEPSENLLSSFPDPPPLGGLPW